MKLALALVIGSLLAPQTAPPPATEVYLAPLSGGGSRLQIGALTVVKQLDPVTKKTTTITEGLAGSDYLAWLPDGRMLMAAGDNHHVAALPHDQLKAVLQNYNRLNQKEHD